MMWKWLCLFFCLILASASDDRPEYTEDLDRFKSDKLKVRLELLVGCWLMSREYLPNASQHQNLALVKSCLKHINRKDSVVKITSLIGKNMTATKTYQQIVPSVQIPQPGHFFQAGESAFDGYLLGLIKNYEKDLVQVNAKEGEEIKRRVQQQVEKRTKYYFGIIPVNQWTHLLMLISISLILVMCCTCWKYFQLRKVRDEQRKKNKEKEKEQYFKQGSSFTKDPKASNKPKCH